MLPSMKIYLGTALLAALSCFSAAAHGTASEYQVKAALLYKVSKFVQWPDSAFPEPGAPLFICILGKNPFEPAIDMTQPRRVQGHPVVIKLRPDLPAAHMDCHVLFISDVEPDELKSLLLIARNQPVLTVGETDGFARQGGILQFTQRRGRVHFVINRFVLHLGDLHIDTRLLELATVIDSPG
jgi:hypothetical protein